MNGFLHQYVLHILLHVIFLHLFLTQLPNKGPLVNTELDDELQEVCKLSPQLVDVKVVESFKVSLDEFLCFYAFDQYLKLGIKSKGVN